VAHCANLLAAAPPAPNQVVAAHSTPHPEEPPAAHRSAVLVLVFVLFAFGWHNTIEAVPRYLRDKFKEGFAQFGDGLTDWPEHVLMEPGHLIMLNALAGATRAHVSAF
jgi:hypothetical protein